VLEVVESLAGTVWNMFLNGENSFAVQGLFLPFLMIRGDNEERKAPVIHHGFPSGRGWNSSHQGVEASFSIGNGACRQIPDHFAEAGGIVQPAALGDDGHVIEELAVVFQHRRLLVFFIDSPHF